MLKRDIGESADRLPEFLTTSEVAKALKVTPSTLCRWRARGVGPRVFWLGAASPRYKREDVTAWLEDVMS